ncbi:pentatricopeptide repeat-containing protein At3g28660-like [Lycium ferocissimum]|uniref:pentatricopeptide repeat-containing protein At3g28660-like n=1 Tax=Lycium ferocissimum TaxID=112874 RepID=UPI002814F556|nr:pentatricopeptide repeat-containing protein At3g28660-like [Lycium ferocissimum]
MNYLNNIHLQVRPNNSFQIWKWCMSMAENCTNMRQLKSIHAIYITLGLHRNTYAISKLLDFCALSNSSSSNLNYASRIFSQVQTPNTFLYNTLIKAHSLSPQPELSLHYFNQMLQTNNNDVVPDSFTFPFLLIACANGNLEVEGKQIHSWVIKNSFSVSNAHVQTALIRFYMNCKELGNARKVFDEITDIDVIQCNVLMSGYLQCGQAKEALSIFQDMMGRGVSPDEYCVTTALAACANLGALDQGKWIHEHVMKSEWVESDVFIGSALVDMYAKCGCIQMASEVFESMPTRNKHSWATMIRGFAVHGRPELAISCLEKMQVVDGLKPDGVVVLAVLAACAHAGLQKEGEFLLEKMESLYGVAPEHEHFSCVVDLLCRAGRLDDALELIRRMPMKPRASVWGALLSGCRNHNNVNLAELAVKEILLVEDGNEAEEDSAYVQLSNIHLAARQCDDARQIRRMIGDRGLRKTPGYSAVEIDGIVNEFVSGDVSHACLADIHVALDLIYVDPDFSNLI